MTGHADSEGVRGRDPIPGGASHDAVFAALSELGLLGDRATVGGSLGALTTYRVGGDAALLVAVESVDELASIARAVEASRLPVLVVGRGSNLLVADAGFGGIAVTLDAPLFQGVSISGTGVRAGASVPLPALARQTVEAGLTGFEWAVGVPGSVGGGVRMNAGGHGSDIAATLQSCTVVELGPGGGRPDVWVVERLDFAYRHSSVSANHVVTEAEFELAPGDTERGRQTIREIVRWRREHQPGGQNAGSVFTNPPGDSAGRLIELAGLKGRRWRSATVSPKHANFIQAEDGGSADDVKALMDQMQRAVLDAHGVALSPEVRLIGFPDKPSTSSGEFRA